MKNTPIRIFLRELRAEREESVGEMFKKLGVSRAYLNFVENGVKTASPQFIETVIAVYALDEERANRLRIDAWASSDSCKLDVSALNYKKRKTVREIAESMADH